MRNSNRESINWGILATGRIAGIFATGLQTLDDANLVAVGSRSQESANRFGDEFDIPHRHSSYEALAADPDVDVVYVSTPHPMHKACTMLMLEAGKAVLCEKPFTLNAAEARAIVDLAREKNCFLMEAMWTRFLPMMAEVRRLVRDGAIGEVRMINSSMGFRTDFNPASRLFDPALGGGALLDVGVYAVSFVSMLLGQPERVTSMAELGETGVDEQSAAILGYPGGEIATIQTGIRTQTGSESVIMGTEGMIRIRPLTSCVLQRSGQEPEEIEVPIEGNGYHYQAAEVMNSLRNGKTESEIMSLDETIAIMETMDRIREQWGLRYPGE